MSSTLTLTCSRFLSLCELSLIQPSQFFQTPKVVARPPPVLRGEDVEEDITTESVDSIEYIGKHGKERSANTEPVDSIEFIGKPAKISSSFTSSQKNKKTVKFNDLVDTEVNEALFEYDQIIGDFSDVGTESVSLNTTTSGASDSSTERSLAESDGSDVGEMGEVSGKNESETDEESVEQMLDDIHKTHQLSREDLER